MGFLSLFVLVPAGFVLASLILPWLLRTDIHELGARLRYLEGEIAALRERLQQGKPANEVQFAEKRVVAPPNVTQREDYSEAQPTEETSIKYHEPEFLIPVEPIREEVTQVAEENSSNLFEFFAATKLPIWIGAAAIVFAVIYLVRYSIEMGLLGPGVRLVLGMGFGVALLIGGQVVDILAELNQSRRISQALTAAGLAACYASIYAANAIYGFLPAVPTFVGLAGIAALGVFLSLRQGLPIAALSSIFGFLTPALVGADHPNSILLFGYLYVLFLSVNLIARRQQWQLLTGLSVLMVYGWTILWLVASFDASLSWVVMLFLLAVTMTILLLVEGNSESDDDAPSSAQILKLGSAAIGIALTAAVLPLGHYAWSDAVLYGVLTSAMAVLALRDEEKYRPMFLLAAVLSFMLLLVWIPADANLIAMIGGTTSVFIVYHLVFTERRSSETVWATFATSTLVGSFVLLRIRFHDSALFFTEIPHIWGLIAFGYAIIGSALACYAHNKSGKTKKLPTAVYSVGATALIALGCAIEVSRYYLPIALGIEVFAVFFIFYASDLKAFYKIPALLTGGLIVSFLPFAPLLLGLLFGGLSGHYRVDVGSFDLRALPVQFGIPAVALGASLFFINTQAGALSKLLVYTSGLLATFAAYFLIRSLAGYEVSHYGAAAQIGEPEFILRSIITISLYTLALGCFLLERQTGRSEWLSAAQRLFFVTLARNLYFDVLISNPLFVTQNVGSTPFFNGLLLAYAVPPAILYVANRQQFLTPALRSIALTLGVLFLFVFVNLSVRYIYHGAVLTQGTAPNAETYSYSVAWLLFGVGLLAGGIYGENQKLRYASLAMLLLTVSKVFLYDASALAGLYRVFSFLGLGFSLIGISYFYSRLVFSKKS